MPKVENKDLSKNSTREVGIWIPKPKTHKNLNVLLTLHANNQFAAQWGNQKHTFHDQKYGTT